MESLTKAILWKILQRDPIGKPHNRNPLETATKGFYWKASQQESFGKLSGKDDDEEGEKEEEDDEKEEEEDDFPIGSLCGASKKELLL